MEGLPFNACRKFRGEDLEPHEVDAMRFFQEAGYRWIGDNDALPDDELPVTWDDAVSCRTLYKEYLQWKLAKWNLLPPHWRWDQPKPLTVRQFGTALNTVCRLVPDGPFPSSGPAECKAQLRHPLTKRQSWCYTGVRGPSSFKRNKCRSYPQL